MTEAEWTACTDPQKMLEFLRTRASERKLRLFAVGCCRRVWAFIKDEPFRAAVRAAELFADGMITKEEMTKTRKAAIPCFVQLHSGDDEAPGAALSAAAIPAPKKSFFEQLLDAFDDPWWEDESDIGDPHGPALITARHAAWAAAHAKGQRPLTGSLGELAEQREQANLLRDIIGNPFRPVTLDPAWLTRTVTGLAAAVYEEQAFDRLPILADALEESGCTSQDILAHCRLPGVHVRGCWALDLILSKDR
jgi:hypothetical protein